MTRTTFNPPVTWLIRVVTIDPPAVAYYGEQHASYELAQRAIDQGVVIQGIRFRFPDGTRPIASIN